MSPDGCQTIAAMIIIVVRRHRHTCPIMIRQHAIPLLFVLMATLLTGSEALGQPAAASDDVATIEGIMAAYYDVVSGPAGERADAARDSSLHHPEAWIAIAGTNADGEPTVNVLTLADYYGTNPPRAQGFFEWETSRDVRRSGNIAHVWSSYASARTPGGEPFDTGVNAVTLWYDGTRWWIMNWMFDRSAD